MSTFLELSQSLRQEVGGAGTGPTTVVSQTGEYKRYVDWITQSYIEIQNRTDWRWLRVGFTVDTTASDDSYAPTDCTDVNTSSAISRFGRWRVNDREDPPKVYLTSAGSGGERWLIYVPWERFRQIYKIGTQNDGSPTHVTIDPEDNLVIGPAPNDIYTITGDYYRSAQTLAADGDIPEMPVRFHQLIVYRAMEKYAGYENSPSDMTRAKGEGRTVLRQLERDQRSRMRKKGAMA